MIFFLSSHRYEFEIVVSSRPIASACSSQITPAMLAPSVPDRNAQKQSATDFLGLSLMRSGACAQPAPVNNTPASTAAPRTQGGGGSASLSVALGETPIPVQLQYFDGVAVIEEDTQKDDGIKAAATCAFDVCEVALTPTQRQTENEEKARIRLQVHVLDRCFVLASACVACFADSHSCILRVRSTRCSSRHWLAVARRQRCARFVNGIPPMWYVLFLVIWIRREPSRM